MKTYTIDLFSGNGLDEAIRAARGYRAWVARKSKELCERLAGIGAARASLDFSHAAYDGANDVTVTVEEVPNGYAVKASGGAVLFIEFGAGAAYGGGHPEAGELGMGPGTYPIPPGKGHWNDPRGWYLPKSAGGGHTYGNPPAMAMYNARKEVEQRILQTAREVFSGD